jgi:hypothetical protein
MGRFAYYENLDAGQKRTYRESDAIRRVEIPDVAALVPLARAIDPILASGNRAGVQQACQGLVDGINSRLGTPSVEVRVMERRPANSAGELQGLYDPDEVTGGPRASRSGCAPRSACRWSSSARSCARCCTRSAITSTTSITGCPTPSTRRVSTRVNRR